MKEKGWCVYQDSFSGRLKLMHWNVCPPRNWRYSGKLLNCVGFLINKTIKMKVK